MKLYLAGAEGENSELLKKLNDCNLLFSYFYKPTLNTLSMPHEVLNSLSFVDSGAFSAWTRGVTIDTDTYIGWINERSDFIDLYGQLDIITGTLTNTTDLKSFDIAASKTWENYLYMRPKMKNPDGLLYTYHAGDPIIYLKTALEWTDEEGNHIPYIALGSVVGNPRPIREKFFDICFNTIKKSSNPNVKVHAFGMTDFDLLGQFPITSADSTSWIMAGAMGCILSDYGTLFVSAQHKHNKKHYSNLTDSAIKNISDMVNKFGLTLTELESSRDNRIIYNALYMTSRASKIDNTKCFVRTQKLF